MKAALLAGVLAAETPSQQLRAVTVDAALSFTVTYSLVDKTGKLRALAITVDDTALLDADALRRATAAATRVAKLLLSATGSTYVISSAGSAPTVISTSEIQ